MTSHPEEPYIWRKAVTSRPIYLSRETGRLLELIANAKTPLEGEPGRIVTADHIAEELVSAALKEKYPQVLEYQKAVKKIEDELLKTFQ